MRGRRRLPGRGEGSEGLGAALGRLPRGRRGPWAAPGGKEGSLGGSRGAVRGWRRPEEMGGAAKREGLEGARAAHGVVVRG